MIEATEGAVGSDRRGNDIYDRSLWPTPESNPIVILLKRGDDWYSNKEIVAALGLSPNRALLSNSAARFSREILPEDTAVAGRRGLVGTSRISAAHGGSERLFSRRGLVLAAMRTDTVNAAAFRDWLASEAADIAFVPQLSRAAG
ncbi:hypothetical protein [Erythrobacter sp.]|uniref:hypothetical protein n=1 Tax=Erythrobacter sp. TaxID=1042 RepID=UPI0026015C31|nr:hypothetical protein [Erythrobacter sp.]